MKNKKSVALLGMLAMVLVFGMAVVGCASMGKPKTFVKGSSGDTTILLRDGLEYDRAFREIAFVLNRHGFESETIQPEVGYIRTRWTKWVSTQSIDAYKVRIVCNFNPSRTQLIVKAEAEMLIKGEWVQGHDSKAIADIRNDLNMAVGN